MKAIATNTGHRAGEAVVIVCGPALVSLIPMAVAPAMPQMEVQFGLTGGGGSFAQLVMSSSAFALPVCAVLLGIIEKRLDKRVCLLASLLLFALSGAAGLWIRIPSILIGSRLGLGASGGGVLAMCLALAGDYREGGPRERLLGFAAAAEAAVAVFALIAGGSLVEWAGWRAPCVLYLSGVFLFAVAWFAIPRAPSKYCRLPTRTGDFRPPWPLYALCVVLAVAVFIPALQGPFILRDLGVGSAAQQGRILALSPLAAATSALWYGRVRTLLAPEPLLALTTLLLGAGIAVMGFAPVAAVAAVGCLLQGLGAGLVEPLISAIIFKRTPESHRIRAAGLLIGALFVGQFANPYFLGPLRQYLGGATNSFVILGTAFIMLALCLAVHANGVCETAHRHSFESR